MSKYTTIADKDRLIASVEEVLSNMDIYVKCSGNCRECKWSHGYVEDLECLARGVRVGLWNMVDILREDAGGIIW